MCARPLSSLFSEPCKGFSETDLYQCLLVHVVLILLGNVEKWILAEIPCLELHSRVYYQGRNSVYFGGVSEVFSANTLYVTFFVAFTNNC